MYSTLNEEKSEIRIILLHPKENGHLVCTLETISIRDPIERGPREESVVGGFLLRHKRDNRVVKASVAYEAVSYTWGNPGDERVILLNGKEFKVRQNLWNLRHDFRIQATARKTSRKLWVDAICINQDDPAEKGWQIPKMKSIYELAERVLVWLGPRTDNSTRAMRPLLGSGRKPWHGRRVWQLFDDYQLRIAARMKLRDAFRNCHTDFKVLESIREEMCSDEYYEGLGAHDLDEDYSLWFSDADEPGPSSIARDLTNLRLADGDPESASGQKVADLEPNSDDRKEERMLAGEESWRALGACIASSAWWNRLWIAQELVVAYEVFVSFGPDGLTWNQFMEVIDYTAHHQPSFNKGLEAGPLPDVLETVRILDQVRLKYHDDWENRGEYMITNLLAMFRSFQSLLPEDKIFALLGLWTKFEKVETPEQVVSRYTRSAAETYKIYTRAVLEQEVGMSIFHHVGELDRADDLPSWVPDLRARKYAEPFYLWGGYEHMGKVRSWDSSKFEVSDDATELRVGGVVLDKIKSLVSPNHLGEDPKARLGVGYLAECVELAGNLISEYYVKTSVNNEPESFGERGEGFLLTMLGNSIDGIELNVSRDPISGGFKKKWKLARLRKSAEPWDRNPYLLNRYWDVGHNDDIPDFSDPVVTMTETFDGGEGSAKVFMQTRLGPGVAEMTALDPDLDPDSILMGLGVPEVAASHPDSILMKLLTGRKIELSEILTKAINMVTGSPVPDAEPDALDAIPAQLARMHRYRRFSTTDSDRMALVPVAAQTGDIICALDYSFHPVVLRPVEDVEGAAKYRLIGLCFYHGFSHIMLYRGTLIGWESSVRDFTIV